MNKWLLHAGRLEGLSFLALLLIGMPLKYYGGMPMSVKIIGPVHGMLFVAYIAMALFISSRDDWQVKKLFLAIVAAIIPLGTFWFERNYLRDERY